MATKAPDVALRADAATNASGKHQGSWLSSVDEKGEYKRKESVFRQVISADPAAEFSAEADRYAIYVSHACPWAHRAMVVRALKGLEHVIDVAVVDHFLGEGGWKFTSPEECPGSTVDHINGKRWLREVYKDANPDYSGNITVPCVWDKKLKTIVNNESSEVIRMLNSEFNAFAKRPDVDLYPEELRPQIDEINALVYPNINNGVYRCGFAQTQEAYEKAFGELFGALDAVEERLSRSRFLVGNRLTEADIRLFTTLVRFDPVYVQHFKTNLRRIVDYPNLWGFTKDIYQLPGVAGTVNIDHIKKHYCGSHKSINPLGIVPAGPEVDFAAPHDRDRFGPIEGI